MKRTKNVRKKKAIAKAVSQNEKSATKIEKNESKTLRTKSAKTLYDWPLESICIGYIYT